MNRLKTLAKREPKDPVIMIEYYKVFKEKEKERVIERVKNDEIKKMKMFISYLIRR